MNKVIICKFWTIKDVRKNKTHLYVFGDNDKRTGKGGQAIIRYEPNAVGIPTKKYPSYNNNAYYYDTEYEENIKKIDVALFNVLREFIDGKYDKLVIPKDGFGTGLAKLPINAPKTHKYLKTKIKALIKLFS